MAERVLGAVLAGGASSRFGSDKALAMWRGRTLLDHARALLENLVDDVVAVGRVGGVPDLPEPGLGPLGGIAGALDHGARSGFASVLTIGCDMPEVPAALLRAFLERTPVYCADAPVLGHWPVAFAPALFNHLATITPSPRPRAGVHGSARLASDRVAERWMPGRARRDVGARKDGALSVRRWAQSIGAAPITAPAPLRNVNAPADLPS